MLHQYSPGYVSFSQVKPGNPC